MRSKLLILFLVLSAAVLMANLYNIFFKLPDELNQGMVYRIIYFHVAAVFAAFTAFFAALICSIGYLSTKNMRYDAIAAPCVEVGLAFATINLVTGSIWGRYTWGVWWTWDARLTSMLVCWLLYAGYLMLRRAVEEPTQRARLSAVLSIFAFADIVIVWKSIEWWRTQHPQPVLSLRGGGGMSHGMEPAIYWNYLAFAILAAVLTLVRMRQENIRREIDSMRRFAHTL